IHLQVHAGQVHLRALVVRCVTGDLLGQGGGLGLAAGLGIGGHQRLGPADLGLVGGVDRLTQGRDRLFEALGLVQQLPAKGQVAGRFAAGFGEVAVQQCQGLIVLFVLGVQLGKHQHRLQMIVVVQRVVFDGLGDIALGAFHVIGVVGRVAGHVGGVGLVVVGGAFLGQDVLGLHQRL